MIKIIRKLIPSSFITPIIFLLKDFRLLPILFKERYKVGETQILGKSLCYADSASFLFLYDEIFIKGIYNFETDKKDPLIIDCGANIGLSIIFLKKLFPKSYIIAFEPDKKIYSLLKDNIQSFGFSDIELHRKGLWNEETTLEFFSDESDGGSLVNKEISRLDTVKIETTLLSNFLKDKVVDFLKIDIEGAELEVLLESAEYLKNVQRIFIEYHSFVGKEQKLSDIIQILNQSGFRIIINNQGLFSPQPFLKINTASGMDMQLNIFGIRM
ncbi:MAG: FkbM family methyltransferase [Thalassobius sp.]|nr:FkbM family methyltransferase [Thalassovita sp.]